MSKGCLKIFALLIIAAAVIYYTVDKYGGEFFQNKKEKIIRKSIDTLTDKLDGINGENAEKLKNIIYDFSDSIDWDNLDEEFEKIKNFISIINRVIQDSSITDEEIDKIKRKINL